MENAQQQRTSPTMEQIKNWILFLLLVAGLGAGWAAVDARVQAVEAQCAVLELRAAKTDEATLQIQVKLAEIQRDIVYIRQTLDAQQ